ncbi:hypothetical protein GCM10027596_00450 [Nocardioides korecus]
MSQHSNDTTTSTSPALLIALAWLIVLVPLAYGLWQTLVKAAQLLGG